MANLQEDLTVQIYIGKQPIFFLKEKLENKVRSKCFGVVLIDLKMK